MEKLNGLELQRLILKIFQKMLSNSEAAAQVLLNSYHSQLLPIANISMALDFIDGLSSEIIDSMKQRNQDFAEFKFQSREDGSVFSIGFFNIESTGYLAKLDERGMLSSATQKLIQIQLRPVFERICPPGVDFEEYITNVVEDIFSEKAIYTKNIADFCLLLQFTLRSSYLSDRERLLFLEHGSLTIYGPNFVEWDLEIAFDSELRTKSIAYALAAE